MTITIVKFKAYSQDFVEPFYGKSFFEIHKELRDKCETYVPTDILVGTIDLESANRVHVDQLLMHKESWENVFSGVEPEKLSQPEFVQEYLKKNFNPPKRKITA